MDEWQYVEREVVIDPKGRQWTVALMDVLGQEGDPDIPNKLLELQYSSDLRIAVIDGSLDPSQPVFRQDLED